MWGLCVAEEEVVRWWQVTLIRWQSSYFLGCDRVFWSLVQLGGCIGEEGHDVPVPLSGGAMTIYLSFFDCLTVFLLSLAELVVGGLDLTKLPTILVLTSCASRGSS